MVLSCRTYMVYQSNSLCFKMFQERMRRGFRLKLVDEDNLGQIPRLFRFDRMLKINFP
jgi:hypothetical protein